jgi:hypothetical protein
MKNTSTIILRLFITLLISFICLNSNATDYYFSNAGNDANAGTSTGAPWQTIAKFNSVFASYTNMVANVWMRRMIKHLQIIKITPVPE